MIKRRTLALTMLGLLVTLFLLAESSFAYVRYYNYQRELQRPTRTEQVEQFIAGLRAGNTQQFRYVEYDLLRSIRSAQGNDLPGVMETMIIRAGERNENWIDWLTDDMNETIRQRVIRSTLVGLKNLDPSVRLTALNLLRRLIPDTTMQMAVKQALAMETVASEWEYWRERNIDIPSSENPWFEGATFWDEDETFGYDDSDDLWVRRSYTTYGDGFFWGFQEGSAAVTDAFNGTHTFEDTTQISEESQVDTGYANWADSSAGGWTGAEVPSGGSWLREHDDIMPYVGDYNLKYLCLKYDYYTNEFDEVYANPWAETYKLDLFITRAVWYSKIKAGQLNCMVIISKDTFKALYLSIDGESPRNIPYPSVTSDEPMLDGSDIDVLIQGILRNDVVTNRWVMVRALKYIYKMDDTTDAQRIKIIRAIRRAKYQENRIDIYRGDELYTELVGETTGERRERGRSFPLGFNTIDDEIDVPDLNIVNIMANLGPVDDLGTADDAEDDVLIVSPPVSNDARWADGVERVVDTSAGANQTVNGWIIDYDDMLVAQDIIDSIRLGETDVLDTVLYQDLRNAVIITLNRVKTQASHDTEQDPVNINITGADAPWLKFFSALQGAIPANYDQGAGVGLTMSKRANIIKASLSGLINPDPRVRLTCIHWLRKCNPDQSMLDAVLEARDIETVLYTRSEADSLVDAQNDPIVDASGNPRGPIDRGDHEYIDCEGFIQTKEANEELRKLYQFIVRRELIDLITSGSAGTLLAEIPRSRFMTLTNLIDNETIDRVPLASPDPNADPDSRYVQGDPDSYKPIIKSSMISTVVYGVRNPNFLNQKETVTYLIDYYNAYVEFDEDEWEIDENGSKLSPAVRNQIIGAILEAKEDDVVIFEHEAILTGELLVQGRAVVEMRDEAGQPTALSRALTYRNQWVNADLIREEIDAELQYDLEY